MTKTLAMTRRKIARLPGAIFAACDVSTLETPEVRGPTSKKCLLAVSKTHHLGISDSYHRWLHKAINCIVLYCIVLYCIVLYCIVLYCIVLYCIVLHCIALHCIALHCIALHCIALHCIALHCTALHCT